jgi:alpha-galactosidase
MSAKIVIIGAGAFGWTTCMVRDLLVYKAFEGTTFVLMDINESRLPFAARAAERIIREGGHEAKVVTTTSRAKALEGADGVVSGLGGSVDIWRHDIEIPKKYGVDVAIGDTRGPSGILRALRTIPLMLDICGDIEKYCPKAIFLNYTNPMPMLCRAMQTQYPKLNIAGLCHSVQGTAEMLARWIGAKNDEITYTCAGINHQSFYLEFLRNGEDAYPAIRKAVEDPEIYREEIVRNEIFKALGYFPTETSGHNSEYCAWFRKRQDLIEKYCLAAKDPYGAHAYGLKNFLKKVSSWEEMAAEWLSQPLDLKPSHEYGAGIFNAVFGDGTPYKFNGNVRNFALVDNLPYGACVEVPVLASRRGFEPIHVGPLPNQVAALVQTNAICEEMAVEGSLTGDIRKVYQACIYDPLASAVLCLEEIRLMLKEMLEKSRDYLPQFKDLGGI